MPVARRKWKIAERKATGEIACPAGCRKKPGQPMEAADQDMAQMQSASPEEETPATGNPPCPWLPVVTGPLDFSITRRHGEARGEAFYLDALRYAQALWTTGKPAQALLQLNKAWIADLPAGAPVLLAQPAPYQALVWIMEMAATGNRGYLGNPVRHFQHLASRMSGPRATLRAWRAWLCFHMAEATLGHPGFPRDGEQIAREGLWIPSHRRALEAVSKLGWTGETRLLIFR
jgi:hypothetical protein